jgi:hypothetical protein
MGLFPCDEAMAQNAGITVGTTSGRAGAAVNISVGFTPGATPVSTLQFDLLFSSSLSYNSVSTGQAALNAGKSASGSAISGGARILVFGLNQTAIGSGAVANIQFTIASGAPVGSVAVAIGGIVASDANANPVSASGTGGSVTVLASADGTPPTISGVTTSSISDTGATISWTTNEAADTQVDYGTTGSYGSSTTLNSTMTTSHSQGLTGLTANTLYHYRVISKDAAGNLAVSSDNTFTTNALRSTAPVISAIAVSVTSTSATITWKTDKPSDSAVDYWVVNRTPRKAALAMLATTHSLTLNKLQKSTTYQFQVKSTDSDANLAVTAELSFTTTARSARTLSVPLVPSEYSSLQIPGTYENSMIGFALANTGTETATVTFTAVDDSGNLITGPGITNPSVRVLNPYTQKAFLDSDMFGEGIQILNPKGWAKLESTNSDVSGFYLIFDSGLSYMDGASFGDTSLKNLLLSEIQPVGATSISIANTGSEATTVTFNLMKADGTIRSSRSMEIRASGAFVGDLYRDVFPGTEPDSKDYVLMDSTAGVQAFALMQSLGDISSLTGQNSAMGAATLYSPQYVTGDSWRTRLSVINLDSQPGIVTMRLMDDNGVVMGAARRVPIAANGKLYIDDPEFFTPLQGGAITTGYLKIQSDGVRLAGSTVFGDSTGMSFSAALPLIDDLRDSVLYGHIASNDMYFTGIAMVNPNADDAIVDIAVVGADGITICRKMDVLPAMQKKSKLLTEFFPALVGQELTSGYILINSTQPIASYSLFGTNSPSVLSAIPPQ